MEDLCPVAPTSIPFVSPGFSTGYRGDIRSAGCGGGPSRRLFTPSRALFELQQSAPTSTSCEVADRIELHMTPFQETGAGGSAVVVCAQDAGDAGSSDQIRAWREWRLCARSASDSVLARQRVTDSRRRWQPASGRGNPAGSCGLARTFSGQFRRLGTRARAEPTRPATAAWHAPDPRG